MALAILTPEEVNTLVENEPATGSRTHKLTLMRNANLDALVAAPVGAGFKVTTADETKENGEPNTLGSILAAYNRIVKSRKLTGSISVRKLHDGADEVAVLVSRVK